MHITVITICHKHMLATIAYHQDKSYSKTIRQYPKRTIAQFPLAYYHINITKCNPKYYFTFRGMSRVCHFMVQCQKGAKICCSKIQIVYTHKIAFLILMALTIGI